MKKVRVKDVASINALKFNFKGRIEVDYLDTGSLTENCFERTEKIILGKDILPSRAQRAVKDKTILYSTVRPRQHHFGIVEDTSENLVVSSGFVTIDADPESIDPFFLYYSITRPDKIEHICRIADSAVSSYPSVNPDDIANLEIEIEESLDDQRKIASVLHDIELKMRSNTSVIAELESMAKDIYDYWFVQFDFPDENGKPYKSSGGNMIWNEELKREIPEGWIVKQLNEMCSFSNGINYDKNEVGDKKYHIVNVRNITASSFLLDNSEFDEIELRSSQADRYMINDSDILVARSGTPGAVRLLLNNDQNTIFCGFIIRCIPKNDKFRFYLSFALKQYEGTNATTTGGSILQNVSQDTLGRVSVVVPQSEIVDTFSSFVSGLFTRMQNAIEENQQLASLRDWLLPMLMNGQVKVGGKA